MLRSKTQEEFRWRPGRPTVISFCALWCDTWKTQVRNLARARASLGVIPVDFLVVSVDGRWAELAEPSGWTWLSDPGCSWCASIGIDRIPYTLVVDERGVVRWAAYGIVRSETLAREVRAALRPQARGVVYLSFDDFPSPRGDDQLLDELRRADVAATFFSIGKNLLGHEAVVRRAFREGHAVQVHSWSHDATTPELVRCKDALSSLGAPPTLYRPPGSSKIYDLDGAERPFLSINPADYTRPDAAELARRVVLGLKDKAVIMLHAGVDGTREALPEIIRAVRARGFEFGVLK